MSYSIERSMVGTMATKYEPKSDKFGGNRAAVAEIWPVFEIGIGNTNSSHTKSINFVFGNASFYKNVAHRDLSTSLTIFRFHTFPDSVYDGLQYRAASLSRPKCTTTRRAQMAPRFLVEI